MGPVYKKCYLVDPRKRDFSSMASILLNIIPLDLTLSLTLPAFRKALKTELCCHAWGFNNGEQLCVELM